MESEIKPKSALERAVDKAGSQNAFGKIVGRSQSMVSLWLKDDMPLPAECVLRAEKGTGVSRHDLRPDLYPREEKTEPARQSVEQPPKPASCPSSGQDLGGPSSPADDGIAA